ncbi:hypothetical protein [Lacisediminihabitans sp.]|jgi:hypothetical protein|uniref:hypothetical protein n=1 Tax=Lacisediminihabitans sp. TaxID=2787631 RepID=UPI002F94D717
MSLSKIIDQITFGAWWETQKFEEALAGSTPEESEYICRCLVGYREVASLLGWASNYAVFDGFEDAFIGYVVQRSSNGSTPWPSSFLSAVRSGESVDWSSFSQETHSSRRAGTNVSGSGAFTPEWEELSRGEIEREMDSFLAAATPLEGDLQRLSGRLEERWNIQGRSHNEAVAEISIAIARALADTSGVQGADSFTSAIIEAPKALEPLIDMAMFMPTPLGTPRVILISKRFSNLANNDSFAASRLLLAVSHELWGHAEQFHQIQLSPTQVSDAVLDRELLEGWAIHREALLALLGNDERTLSDLYRAKRVLPLIRRAVSPSDWDTIQRQVEAVWPHFFSSRDTAVLRRTIGAHARGLIRVERLLRPGSRIDGVRLGTEEVLSPWIVPTSPL